MPPAPMLRLALLAAVLAGLLVAGCGGGGESGAGQGGEEEQAAAEPLEPPRAKESLDEARRRIERLAAAGDCDRVNELNPITRTGLDTPARCEYLRRLAGLEVTDSEEFPGGGLIEYADGGGVLTAILIVDSDRRYHLALYDLTMPDSTVGTSFASEFDRAAAKAAEALREPDCDRYLELVHRYGSGAALKPGEACEALASNPVQAVLAAAPEATPQRLGGNSRYAFYSLASADLQATMVLARQSNRDLPAGVEPLPAEAPEYAFIDAYVTSPPPE